MLVNFLEVLRYIVEEWASSNIASPQAKEKEMAK